LEGILGDEVAVVFCVRAGVENEFVGVIVLGVDKVPVEVGEGDDFEVGVEDALGIGDT
jgi:hypothetical protein